MDLDRLYAVAFTSLDGAPLTGRDVVRRRVVLMLIDAYRARPERSAAEIAWMHERLDPDVGLVLVWPRGARDQALAIDFIDHGQMVLDTLGDYRRMVSPSGKRLAVLADPGSGEFVRVTAESPLFAVGKGGSDGEERGADRTMNLGDLY